MVKNAVPTNKEFRACGKENFLTEKKLLETFLAVDCYIVGVMDSSIDNQLVCVLY